MIRAVHLRLLKLNIYKHFWSSNLPRNGCIATALIASLLYAGCYPLVLHSQTLQPDRCVKATFTKPGPIYQVPINISLPTATTINVRNIGAAGDGQHNDSAVIQATIDSNPGGTIFFPRGTYLLDNSSFDHPGLDFAGFHGTAVMQAGGRFVCNTITPRVAAQCIRIIRASNATFDNFRVGYVGDSQLPWARNEATNNGILVEASDQIMLNNTTVESSPGSGIWVTNSTSISFQNGVSVANTTADGLHFENVGNAVVSGFTAHNTGDDSLAATNVSKGIVNCGLTASNIQIFGSRSRGISVAGACKSTFSSFWIDGTANSGLGVAQDPNFATLVPSTTNFFGGTVLNSGRIASSVVSGKDCIDIATSVGTTVSDVSCGTPIQNGVFIDDNADRVALKNVSVDTAPNVGFVAVDTTNISMTNTTARNTLGGGYVLQRAGNGTLQGAVACSTGGYGFYHQQVSNFNEFDLLSYDSSEGNTSNRAWWVEAGSANVTLNDIAIMDDLTAATIVVGGAMNSGKVNASVSNKQLFKATSVLVQIR